MTTEEFKAAVESECTGPEHNDYYVAMQALTACLEVMTESQCDQAWSEFKHRRLAT
jgi:hypothetical protein